MAILINDVTPYARYTATAGQTLFTVPFEFFNESDLIVLMNDVTLTYSPTPADETQYSVTGANQEGGGSITLGAPGASLNDDVVIYRAIPIARSANYPETGPMAIASLNTEQAKHIGIMQQLQREADRAVLLPLGEAGFELPAAADRASKVLAFDANGDPLAADAATHLAPLGAFGVTLVANATAADARSDLGINSAAELAAPAGSALVGFLQAGTGAVARTAQAKMRETYTDTDFSTLQAAVDAVPARGGRINIPAGKRSLTSTLLVDAEDISITGASQKASEIEADHDNSAIRLVGQTINLPNCKFSVSDLLITKKTGNTLDVNGFPQVAFVGTGLEFDAMFCGDVQRVQIDRFGVGLDLTSVYMSTFNQVFIRNCWMGLKCSTPIDGVSTGNTFLGGCFNNSAFDLTNGEKFTFIGTNFEASSTTCVVSNRNIFQNCRFERMHVSRSFFTWLDIQGDYNKFVGSQFFWDASTFVGNSTTDFYVNISGDGNYLEAQKLFIHQNFVKLTSTSTNNTILFNAPFTDYANTNSNNSYRRSGRLFIDQGTRNRLIFDNTDGRLEIIGTESQTAVGNLSNYLRYDPLSNLTINAATLTIEQSDIAGPCGIPASHVDNKKFTIASIASTIRARTPDLATADGSTVYSIGVYVYIPSGGTQPTKVRIGDGSGTFTDIFPADGTDRWHWVPVFTQPANASTVQLMIEAEGDVNDVFYVALPTVSEGNIPAYVPPPRGKTSWTAKTTAKQIGLTEIQTLFGGDETGVTFTPTTGGFSGTVSAATGQYTKRGDMVDFIIKLTGSSFSASAFAATVSLPFSGGDGSLVINDTDASTNIGTGLVLNGTAYLPAVSSTNSLQIQGSYRLANI